MIDIRLRYLDDVEAERLYTDHPELGRSPDDYCPTCAKNPDVPCDCEMQLQLRKHYLTAGIGATYQTLGWDDLVDNKILAEVIDYAQNKEYVRRGAGLILHGGLGNGKTLAGMLLLKEFVKDGLNCFVTTFSQMVELYTAGWYSDEERKYFNRKVMDSQVLLLDDVGRELKRKTRLSETTFDNVLRTRVQHARSTIITTNQTPEELGQGYGGAVLRLLREKSKIVEFSGDDFSEQAQRRVMADISADIRRPIL